jgi:hypothetical protein
MFVYSYAYPLKQFIWSYALTSPQLTFLLPYVASFLVVANVNSFVVITDNGTNFKGANNEMRKLYELLNKSSNFSPIKNELSNEGIEWRFISPSAAHQGGIWESGINMVKYHLKRRFHGGFTSVARSASLALEESFSFSWWLATELATHRQPRQRACAIERASVELSHQLI